jgi:hypothetical protein
MCFWASSTYDPSGADDVLKVRQGIMPNQFLLTLGDALDNLKTALDYAVNEIEFLTKGERTEHTKFPVRGTRDALVMGIKRRVEKESP